LLLLLLLEPRPRHGDADKEGELDGILSRH
jgi:hypothetical protein